MGHEWLRSTLTDMRNYCTMNNLDLLQSVLSHAGIALSLDESLAETLKPEAPGGPIQNRSSKFN